MTPLIKTSLIGSHFEDEFQFSASCNSANKWRCFQGSPGESTLGSENFTFICDILFNCLLFQLKRVLKLLLPTSVLFLDPKPLAILAQHVDCRYDLHFWCYLGKILSKS